MSYDFRKDWFYGGMLCTGAANYLPKDEIHNILEIGSYEGASSCFFSDNFLDNEKSTLDCVDPFLNDENNDHKDLLGEGEEERFDENIKQSKNYDKVIIHKITSDEFFKQNDKTFDFIYIDGCHTNECVERDLNNSYNCLRDNGIIWMDDYGGGSEEENMRIIVDEFIDKNHCQIIEKGYQIAFKKT